MMLHGSPLSRLITTASEATGSHTLSRRLMQRQFSTASVCKSNAPYDYHARKREDRIKGAIRRLNADPQVTAERKYRTSKRLFAALDYFAAEEAVNSLLFKQKRIVRSLEQPGVLQRLKKGLPDPNLSRAADYFHELRTAYKKCSAIHWHIVKMAIFAPLDDIPVWSRPGYISDYIYREFKRRLKLLWLPRL